MKSETAAFSKLSDRFLIIHSLTELESKVFGVESLGHELSLDEGANFGLDAGEPRHVLVALVEAKVSVSPVRNDLGVIEIQPLREKDNVDNDGS